jgi:hypothetical protein
MFTFVARDPITRQSMAVNPLQPQTPEQRRLFAERQRVADERRAARQQQPAGPASSAGEMIARVMSSDTLMICMLSSIGKRRPSPKHFQVASSSWPSCTGCAAWCYTLDV